MGAILARRVCGTCAHSQPLPQNLTQITCFGAPPAPVVVGMTPAGPNIAMLRPQLAANERACAVWAAKAASAFAQEPIGSA